MRPALILCFSLCLVACENIWFKPGTNNDDLARDKAACEPGALPGVADAEARERRFEECMAAKGWWHSGAENAQATTRGQATTRVATTEPAGAAPSLPAPGTTNTAAAATSPGVIESRERAHGGEAAAAIDTGAGTVSALPSVKSASPGQGWWKLGGRVNDLSRDQARCREKSGIELPAETPYRWGESAVFDQCMRDAGWRGP